MSLRLLTRVGNSPSLESHSQCATFFIFFQSIKKKELIKNQIKSKTQHTTHNTEREIRIHREREVEQKEKRRDEILIFFYQPR